MNAFARSDRSGHTPDPVSELLTDFARRAIPARLEPPCPAKPWQAVELRPNDWGVAAEVARSSDFRWAGGWALETESAVASLWVMAVLEKQGAYLLLKTPLEAGTLELPSQTPWFPGAARPERHSQDAFGIRFSGHPDPRRWLRHQAWPADRFPLRKAFPVDGLSPPDSTPPDHGYPFASATGAGVYAIPVGPVHAGIIEPGHFRFLAVGEQVLNLEERLGYVHKGIEKIAEGRPPEGLTRLAGRVSGDSTVGHAWAACMAIEQAAGVEIPPRAAWLRAIFAERERIANHLGDIGALCNDVAFAFAYYQFTRLRELWLRNNLAWFGHRLLMDRIVPGGVAVDLSPTASTAMRAEIGELARQLAELRPILDDNDSLQDRLQNAGVLPEATARKLGCLGFVARASGIDFDLRRDAPYAPYDQLEVETVYHRGGDVRARLDVRYDEILSALQLLRQLLDRLPPGPHRTGPPIQVEEAEGLGLVEGWRGEIMCYLRFGRANQIERYYPRDPSVFNWPALERLIHGNIVPDFPLCNKSVNASYSGHDL